MINNCGIALLLSSSPSMFEYSTLPSLVVTLTERPKTHSPIAAKQPACASPMIVMDASSPRKTLPKTSNASAILSAQWYEVRRDTYDGNCDDAE